MAAIRIALPSDDECQRGRTAHGLAALRFRRLLHRHLVRALFAEDPRRVHVRVARDSVAALCLAVAGAEPLLAHDLAEPALGEYRHRPRTLEVSDLPGHLAGGVLDQRLVLGIRSQPRHTGLLHRADHPDIPRRDRSDLLRQLRLRRITQAESQPRRVLPRCRRGAIVFHPRDQSSGAFLAAFSVSASVASTVSALRLLACGSVAVAIAASCRALLRFRFRGGRIGLSGAFRRRLRRRRIRTTVAQPCDRAIPAGCAGIRVGIVCGSIALADLPGIGRLVRLRIVRDGLHRHRVRTRLGEQPVGVDMRRFTLLDDAARAQRQFTVSENGRDVPEPLLLEQVHLAWTIDLFKRDINGIESARLHIVRVPTRPQFVGFLCLRQQIATLADLGDISSRIGPRVLPDLEQHIRRIVGHVLAGDILAEIELQVPAVSGDVKDVHVPAIQGQFRRAGVSRSSCECQNCAHQDGGSLEHGHACTLQHTFASAVAGNSPRRCFNARHSVAPLFIFALNDRALDYGNCE